jgi:hypothetical protein
MLLTVLVLDITILFSATVNAILIQIRVQHVHCHKIVLRQFIAKAKL